jgi:hypothetical protein
MEKNPVRSLYSIPVCLLAKVAKQNIFASDDVLSVLIMFAPLGCGGLSELSGLSGTGRITLAWMSGCLVLRMPICGRFMWPLAVAGLGLRYFY